MKLFKPVYNNELNVELYVNESDIINNTCTNCHEAEYVTDEDGTYCPNCLYEPGN